MAAVAAGLSLWLTREWLEERQLDEARTGLLREARVAGELMLRGENDLAVLARVLDLPDLRLSLLDADGNETARALVIPGTFEEGAWVGLEVQAEDQRFTEPMADTSSYMYFFHHDKQGLTWHGPRNAELQYLYLTKGTPCACCGEDKNDIVSYGKCVDITEASFVEGFSMVAGHYRLMENLSLPEGYTIPVDGTAGYVTLDLNGYILTGSGSADVFHCRACYSFRLQQCCGLRGYILAYDVRGAKVSDRKNK